MPSRWPFSRACPSAISEATGHDVVEQDGLVVVAPGLCPATISPISACSVASDSLPASTCAQGAELSALALAPIVDDHLARHPAAGCWKVFLVCARHRISAVNADVGIARALRIARGAACLVVCARPGCRMRRSRKSISSMPGRASSGRALQPRFAALGPCGISAALAAQSRAVRNRPPEGTAGPLSTDSVRLERAFLLDADIGGLVGRSSVSLTPILARCRRATFSSSDFGSV